MKRDIEKLAQSLLCVESKKNKFTEAESRTMITRGKEVGKQGDVKG